MTLDGENAELIIRCIDALEIQRNNAVRSGDPDLEALASIDADICCLGGWIDWLPERMRAK